MSAPSSALSSSSAPRPRLARVLGLVAGALLLAWAFRSLIGHVALVRGQSMRPTLSNGDLVWISSTWSRQLPSRGEVISFRAPDGSVMIKRLVGLAGDTVEVREGVLVLNGQTAQVRHLGQSHNWVAAGEVLPLTRLFGETLEESSAAGTFRTQRSAPSASSPPVTVPQGRAFALGDNRDDSIDSRAFGAIDLRDLEGRLLR